MDFLIWLIIIGVVLLPIAGWIFWMVFFVWLFKSATDQAELQLKQMLGNLEQMAGSSPGGGPAQMNAAQQAQFMNMLTQAQNQMSQLDAIGQQRYDAKMGELMGMAADAGMDWTPGSY